MKLWKILIDKKKKKKSLMAVASLNASTLAKIEKDLPVSMEIISRVCKVLECDIGDVMEILPDKE